MNEPQYDVDDMQAAISREELRRVIKEGQQLTDEHNRQFAMNLLEAGFHIVPCGWLADNQIIVSQKVYDAIKAAGGDGDE